MNERLGPIIFDGDYPMAYSAMDANRDLTLPLADVNDVSQSGRDPERHDGVLATIPEMRRGRVAAALVKVAARHHGPADVMWSYRGAEVAYAVAMGQLAYYRALEAAGHARILETAGGLRQHIDSWLGATSTLSMPIGLVLGMEGADPILSPSQLGEWWRAGLRVVALAHYGVSRYASGTGTGIDAGLTPLGRDLLREMAAVGMTLDVSHTSDRGIREALDMFNGAVLASHSNCRAIVPGERQLPDDLIRALTSRDAVIGVTVDAWMLNFRREYDWSLRAPWVNEPGTTDGPITIEDMANHVTHICEISGGTLHAAIGGDTDGQGGRASAPAEIESVADYARLGDALMGRGFTHEDVENVLWRNWSRIYERALPAA
jgi:membrane dipeptidase